MLFCSHDEFKAKNYEDLKDEPLIAKLCEDGYYDLLDGNHRAIAQGCKNNITEINLIYYEELP